jgi:hypothetical protein
VPGGSWWFQGLMAVNKDADWVTLGWAETLDKKKQKQGDKKGRIVGNWDLG